MSGRTFGVQSSWDDVFKTLGLEISPKQQRKAASIADSMNQQIEEFVNRYAVSATNDKGDLTFDATGTYTFNGDVVINGDLDIGTGAMIWGDDPNGAYGRLDNDAISYYSGSWVGATRTWCGAASNPRRS